MMIYFLALTLVLPACQSTAPRGASTAVPFDSAIDCNPESRQPASLYCQDVFKDRAEIAVARDREEVRDRLLQVDYKEISAAEMARLWEPLSRERDFSRLHDDAFWASLIGFERLQAAKMSETPPVLIFGEETSFNWLAATRRLSAIPKGQFKLDQNIVSLVNRDIYTAHDTHLKFLAHEQKTKRFFEYPNRVRAALNKYLPMYGGTYRRKALYNLHNILKPISEAEYRNIMSNREISGIDFWEMPWSRSGKRYGIFRYPPVEVAHRKLEALMAETNDRFNAIREGRSKEDPIDLAAEFQWRFVQIHPMVNGNGRTGRALMNRMLLEFDLPPSSRRQIDVDYTLNLQEQKDLVREGIYESIRLAANEKIEGRVTSFRRGFGNRLTTKEIQEMTKGVITERNLTNVRDLLPETADQVFEIGGKKFTLGDDMMFIDQYGIPYAMRRAHGQIEMFPVSDKTYILYSLGGAMNGVKNLKRDLPYQTLRLLQGHADFLIEMTRDPLITRKVKVNTYESIEHANNAEQFHFYNWQLPMIRDVVKIKEDPIQDPLAVLVQNRGHKSEKSYVGRTYVEKAFFKDATATEVPEIIGHYLRTDQFYYELRRYLESPREDFLRNPSLQKELLRDIDASREKMHAAARHLLRPFIEEVARLDKADRAFLMNHPQFRLTYEYFIRTPLAFPTLAAAARKLDPSKTVVLRSAASSRVNLTGFISDRQLKDLLLGIPFAGPRFEGFLRDVHNEIRRIRDKGQEVDVRAPFFARKVAEFGANNPTVRNAVRALLEYIFIHPNASRSLDPEMSRAFVTQYLHTQLDLGPKETLSTTTNPTYLLSAKKDGSGNFEAKFAWQDATIYVLELPRDSIRVDSSSGFVVQMEVGMKPLSRSESARATQFKLGSDEGNIYYLPDAAPTDRARRVMEMMFDLRLPGAVDATPAAPSNGRLELRPNQFDRLAG